MDAEKERVPRQAVPPPIYPITPDVLEGEDLSSWISAILESGARWIQYRRKRLEDALRLREIEGIMRAAEPYGARILVDDRCDLCLACGAHGVHLGQDDLPPRVARELLGSDALIGLSTHDAGQARAAGAEPVDYIALGPLRESRTKMRAHGVVPGTTRREVLGEAVPPVVGIGGIGPDDAARFWAEGFQSVAVIGALASNPSAGWAAFMARWGSPSPGGGAGE